MSTEKNRFPRKIDSDTKAVIITGLALGLMSTFILLNPPTHTPRYGILLSPAPAEQESMSPSATLFLAHPQPTTAHLSCEEEANESIYEFKKGNGPRIVYAAGENDVVLFPNGTIQEKINGTPGITSVPFEVIFYDISCPAFPRNRITIETIPLSNQSTPSGDQQEEYYYYVVHQRTPAIVTAVPTQ